ncbi:hypothetical protein HAX54_046740, partial [Datura stramonium]|nr:hypothetical protein [Datura stramonium]
MRFVFSMVLSEILSLEFILVMHGLFSLIDWVFVVVDLAMDVANFSAMGFLPRSLLLRAQFDVVAL